MCIILLLGAKFHIKLGPAFLQSGNTPTHHTRALDKTINHPMVRLQFWTYEEYGACLHCYFSQVHSDTEW